MREASSAPIPASGSSSRSTSGRVASTIAISSWRCSPCDNVDATRSARDARRAASSALVAASATGPGTITLDPPGGTYPAGTVVTVTATPDAGAAFTGFAGDLAGTITPQLLTVDADKTVSASFALAPSFTLTVTPTGAGTVALSPPGGTYLAGTIVTLTATPGNFAWRFGNWGGDATGTSNPLLLTMDASKSVQAAFVPSGQVAPACGIGPELVALLPPLGWLYRRRRARR